MQTFSANIGYSKTSPILTTGQIPLSRVKSADAVTTSGKLFLFGGFDEEDNLDSKVYVLDLKTNVWETQRHSVYREGHSALAISDERLLVYGGVPEDTNNLVNQEFNTEELLIYDLNKKEWSPAAMDGDHIPKGRSRHAACLSSDGKKMYISGGLYKDDLNHPYNDLYCYDIETGVWDGPRKFVYRFDHSIAHYNDKIWSFGGLTKEIAHATEISWFDIKTNTSGSIRINDLPKLEGYHIYLQPPRSSYGNSPILLDIVVPWWNLDPAVEMCIGAHNLSEMTWNTLLTGSFLPLMGHKWRHCFIYGSDLYMLGYPTNAQTNDTSFDYELSTIIKLRLNDLGVVSPVPNSELLENSLFSNMKSLFHEGKFTDFEIIGVQGNERPNLLSTFIEDSSLQEPFHLDSNINTFVKSQPLKVHKTILLARWPHFQRVLESGMIESKNQSLFIPEPISWLRIFIEFLYTDKLIANDINSITGLMVLSHLYELSRLRNLCLQAIYSRGFKINEVLKIWTRSKSINEEVLNHNASSFIFANWGMVVRTKQFRELSKDELLTLCLEVEKNSIIASPLTNDQHTALNNNLITSEHNGFANLPVFGYHGQSVEKEEPNGEDDDDDDEEVTHDNDDLQEISADSFRTRLGTPQASIYHSNPQSGLSSLGERVEADNSSSDDDNDDDDNDRIMDL